jgi:hypothetical protein
LTGLHAELKRLESFAMPLLRYLPAGLFALLLCISCAQAYAASSSVGSAEQQAIESLSPFARRDGKILSLKLNNQRTLKLRDGDTCDIPEQCLVHRLLGLSPDRRFFVVEVLRYESGTMLWIGRHSGTKYEVYGEPAASPNGKWIVTANPSEFGSTNGVFVWQVHAGRLIKKLHFQPESYELYSFVRWENNDSIVLRKLVHADKSICPDAQTMAFNVTVKFDSSLWQFDRNASIQELSCQ